VESISWSCLCVSKPSYHVFSNYLKVFCCTIIVALMASLRNLLSLFPLTVFSKGPSRLQVYLVSMCLHYTTVSLALMVGT
jgi:hypothetical protein